MRILTEPFRLRTWRETAYSLVSLPLGVFWFSLVVTLLATGLGLVITFLGIPLLALMLVLVRGGAALERAWARAILDVDVPPPARAPGPRGRGRLLATLTDLAAWRAVLYFILLLPVSVALFSAAVALWSTAVASISAPAWAWAISEEGRGELLWWRSGGTATLEEWIVVVGGGIVLLFLTPWVLRVLVGVQRVLLRALLGPTRGELERARLAAQRDSAVAASAGERRQIERDLHDGAQARLVALAVDLDRARRRLDEGATAEEARELVRAAHDDAKQALAEVRDLARGIHPAVLTDRGLDAALSSLAARCPVPVALSTEIGERPPEPVEAAAYFVVAEGLTNVARHSGARRAAVAVTREDGALVVEIRDDGSGGAEAAPGTGLAGLEDRVGALGGKLEVESPAGGPTSLRAVIPCAS